MERLRLVVFLVAIIGVIDCALLIKSPQANATVHDVSWPNCDKLSDINDRAGIVGVTGGLSFHKNPCFNREISLFKDLSLYFNTGYPGIEKARKYSDSPNKCSKNDEKCIAYNYGYNAADYGLKYSWLSGALSKKYWLDVETENSWSDSTDINRVAISGMVDRFKQVADSSDIGFYSYPDQWNIVTGSWRIDHPAWVATGSKDYRTALKACSQPSFTGGEVVMAQFTQKLDQNFICSKI